MAYVTTRHSANILNSGASATKAVRRRRSQARLAAPAITAFPGDSIDLVGRADSGAAGLPRSVWSARLTIFGCTLTIRPSRRRFVVARLRGVHVKIAFG